ncbi:MAG: peptidase S8/S53 domain-containing protein, partial [Podila humilis]
IPDSYIVVLKEGQSVANFQTKFDDIARRQNGRGRKPTISRKYETISGFAATINAAALKELLAADEVEFVEQDQIVTLNAAQQSPPSWGLPRISQRNLNLAAPYYYQDQAGSDVTAYVIDTGINTNHVEFGGRATMGANFIQGSANTDENGHGTHVSGTIGGRTYGVAKNVQLVGVKVLNAQGSGSFSGIIAGMDWVVSRARGTKAVVNMSLGGGKSQAVDAAATRIFNAGIALLVAAGNDANADACNGSPSGAQGTFTVGATDRNDRIATFSSWGQCVDAFAPGVNIVSSWIGSSTATNTISGTSMATPHVAGIAALLLSSDSSLTSTQALYTKLQQTSTANVIAGNLNGSPNRLVFNG